MSTNDSTRPENEGRTVATDADQSPPAPDRESPGAEGTAAVANGRPSPAPRAGVPDAGARWEDNEAAHAVPSQGTSPAGEVPGVAASVGSAEGPPPWRRVPGEQPAEPEEPERPSVADSLLSEAPTAFLNAPKAAPAAASAPTAVQDRVEVTGRPDPDVRPSARNRPPRQALLQLKRLDPWSVLKMALALAGVLFLVWMVAAGVLYGVLGGLGVWDRLNGTYADLVTGQTQTGGSLISAGRVFTLAAVVGAINSLLFAVALTIVAFVYNVAADLVGGIEVTLSERD